MPGELRTGTTWLRSCQRLPNTGPWPRRSYQNPAAERGNGGTGAALDG